MRVDRTPFAPPVPADPSLARSRESVTTAASASGTTKEEKVEIIKKGTLTGGFIPFKGKGKPMYVELSARGIVFYDNEKAAIKKRPPKHVVDLAFAFNVHNEHWDPKCGKVVCVMTPDNTMLLKAADDAANLEWYEAMLGAAVTARAFQYGRFAMPQEFFEAAYDVTIVETPKKQERRKGDEPPIANILEKFPSLSGPRRICFYPHTIYLCLRNIEPARLDDLPASAIPPFKAAQVHEIQRKFIPNFGYRDNYFILMMGRGAPMGACELWAECENKQIAEHLHHLLNDIIEREAEKKKRLANGTPQPQPSVPQMPGDRRGHRERSHTQPHRSRLASDIERDNGSPETARERRSKLRESKALVESFEEEQRREHRGSMTMQLLDTSRRTANSPLAGLVKKSSTGTVACTSGSFRTPPTCLGDPSTSNGSLPVPGSRHSFAAGQEVKGRLLPHASVFPTRRQSETIKEEATAYQPMDPNAEARINYNKLMSGDTKTSCRPVSPSTTRSSTDETEDSGGTLRCYGETEDSGGTLKMGLNSRPGSRNGSIRNLSLVKQSPQQYVPIKKTSKVESKVDRISSSEDEGQDADVISAGTNTSTGRLSGGESLSTGELEGEHSEFDYAHMDVVNWNGENGSSLNVPLYKMSTPRSYVSSSDSCYSSIAEKEREQKKKEAAAGGAAPAAAAGGGQEQQPSHLRAHSFGAAHPSMQRPQDVVRDPAKEVARSAMSSSADGVVSSQSTVTGDSPATMSAKEAARSRAFSLGSQLLSHMSRPFRKPSSRTARASNTSTSGVSLASSTASGPQLSSASSNHIAAIPGGGPGGDRNDEYRNRSGSFGSGRSTPYSRRSGPHEASHDHLMELDFGGGPSYHHGLGRCGSGSMGSVDSPSRSRTSSFGCNVRKYGEEEEHTGPTPSQILLAKAKQQQQSFEAEHHDTSDYVETEAPSVPISSLTSASPRMSTTATSSGPSSSAGAHHHHGFAQHHSPDHSSAPAPPPPSVQHMYAGLVPELMSKAHDAARSSQYFETIEETTSGRSSRASSIGDTDTTVRELNARAEAEDEDDYAAMEIGGGTPRQSAASAAAAATAVETIVEEDEERDAIAAAGLRQLVEEFDQPPMEPGMMMMMMGFRDQLRPAAGGGDEGRKGSRSRSTSPSVAAAVSTTRRVDSSSTLQSVASSTSDRENKETSPASGAAAGAVQQMQQQQRQKISTHSEGPSAAMLAAPAGLPKRASVPVLKEGREDEVAGSAPTTKLNYACIQVNGTAPTHDSRMRSKSGILFSASAKEKAAVAAAAAAATTAAAADPPVEYTLIKAFP